MDDVANILQLCDQVIALAEYRAQVCGAGSGGWLGGGRDCRLQDGVSCQGQAHSRPHATHLQPHAIVLTPSRSCTTTSRAAWPRWRPTSRCWWVSWWARASSPTSARSSTWPRPPPRPSRSWARRRRCSGAWGRRAAPRRVCSGCGCPGTAPPTPPPRPHRLTPAPPRPPARCRALKTKHETPKYGLIYHASLIGQAQPKHKGKISRVLAAKCALGVRCDALGDVNDEGALGLEARAKVRAWCLSCSEGWGRWRDGLWAGSPCCQSTNVLAADATCVCLLHLAAAADAAACRWRRG